RSSFDLSSTSAPTKARGDVVQDRVDDVRVVVDPELIGDRQQYRVGRTDGFVSLELIDEDVRLGSVAATKDGPLATAEKSDLVLAIIPAAEIGAVALVHQGENTAAHGYTRLARMPGRLPRLPKDPDLLRLLDVKRASALVDFECRALQAHS